jgi:hypothetical protein
MGQSAVFLASKDKDWQWHLITPPSPLPKSVKGISGDELEALEQAFMALTQTRWKIEENTIFPIGGKRPYHEIHSADRVMRC